MVFFVCERQRNQARGCHTYKSAARSLPVMDETARAIPAWIETERLRICPPQPGDGAEINAAIRETYDALHRWICAAAIRTKSSSRATKSGEIGLTSASGFNAFVKWITTSTLRACHEPTNPYSVLI